MDRSLIQAVLEQVAAGALAPSDALERLSVMPFERLSRDINVDHHRALRAGAPEVVLGEWKTADQIAEMLASLAEHERGALATRVSADKARAVVARVPGAVYHDVARMVIVPPGKSESADERAVGGSIALVAAGTSDRPVAEEAGLTLNALGYSVDRVYDVGVAGLPRLLAELERIRRAQVAIVVAGMEGALPSVLAGLISLPIIAVPTSVGYGVTAGGFAALLSMLGSCAPGITVVNIDNGFGAAVAAVRVLRQCEAATSREATARPAD